MPLYKLEKDFINDAWERSFSMSILLDPSTIQYENSDDNESIDYEPITKLFCMVLLIPIEFFYFENNQQNISPSEGYLPYVHFPI